MSNARAAIKKLVDASQTSQATVPEVELLAASAMLAVEQSIARDYIKNAALEYIELLVAARRRFRHCISGDFDWLTAHVKGAPGMNEAVGLLRFYRERLANLADLFKTGPHRSFDGYTTKDLIDRACIGHDLFRKIVDGARVQKTRRGESHRRFTDREIRKLIAAANGYGTSKGQYAASEWKLLLDE